MKATLAVLGAALAASIASAAVPAVAGERTVMARAPQTQPVNFVVQLPLRNERELDSLIAAQSDPRSPMFRHFLTRQQFAARYGADGATSSAVAQSLRAGGFKIERTGAQGFRVAGTAAAAERMFGIHLAEFRSTDNGRFHAAARDAVKLPSALKRANATVVGLSSNMLRHVESHRQSAQPLNRYSPFGDYWFTDLKQAYDFPAYKADTGKGAVIGIVISSDIQDSDLAAFFNHEKFTQNAAAPVPTVLRRPVFGGAPFSAQSDASFEASLDVQQSLGSAPGATLLLYDIPSLAGDAVQAGYFDVVNDDAADVISSSFGGCELFNSPAYDNGLNQNGEYFAQNELFKQGNAQGQTFVASSGDSSGLGCTTPDYFQGSSTAKFIPGVENPADDPNVTAVGGTNLVTTAPPNPQPSVAVLTSKYVRESEFPDRELPYDPYGIGSNVSGGLWGSGSGISVIFPRPSYQTSYGLKGAGRSVPDVSMQMGGCPGGISMLPCQPDDSASVLAFGGAFYGVIGTSASSPEFAGLLALEISSTGSRLGNVNPSLYQLSQANNALPFHFFHDDIPAANGVVTHHNGFHGYAQVTGLGTPYAQNLIGLPNVAAAGNPQTPTNP